MSDEVFYRGSCSLISYRTIEDSFRRCINNPHYHVVIYVSTSSARYDTMQYISTEFIRPCESWTLQMINSHSESAIYFKNGSFIKIVKANDCCRERRVHYSLLEEGLSDEVIRTLVLPKTIDYNPLWREPSAAEIKLAMEEIDTMQQLSREQNWSFINEDIFDSEDNNELDEFINSFKIINNT